MAEVILQVAENYPDGESPRRAKWKVYFSVRVVQRCERIFIAPAARRSRRSRASSNAAVGSDRSEETGTLSSSDARLRCTRRYSL